MKKYLCTKNFQEYLFQYSYTQTFVYGLMWNYSDFNTKKLFVIIINNEI